MVWFGSSPATEELKATNRPSDDMAGQVAQATRHPSICAPFDATDTRTVVPRARSRTKTSGQFSSTLSKSQSHALVSPGTRFEAAETKATKRPSPEMAGEYSPLQ